MLLPLVQCQANKQVVDDDKEIIVIPDDNQVIPGEIIVELYKDAKIEDVTKDFSKYSVNLLRKISPNLNMYLLYYDISSINSDKMVKLLQKHELVKIAEFNKKVSTRE